MGMRGACAGVWVMVASIRGPGVGETRLTISGAGGALPESKSGGAGSGKSPNKVLLTQEGHSWISSLKSL